MRMEEFPLILERLQDLATASPNGPPRLWDPNAPWSALILEPPESPAYWTEHVITPANPWIARGCPGAAKSNAPDLQLAASTAPFSQRSVLGSGTWGTRLEGPLLQAQKILLFEIRWAAQVAPTAEEEDQSPEAARSPGPTGPRSDSEG